MKRQNLIHGLCVDLNRVRAAILKARRSGCADDEDLRGPKDRRSQLKDELIALEIEAAAAKWR